MQPSTPGAAGPSSVDVVVIGGGMAGVSVAAALATDRQVTVLEAEGDVPVHTTGRSAALFLPGYGNPAVQALTAASRPLFDDLAALWGSPLLSPRPVVYVATPEAPDSVEHLRAAGVADLSVAEAQQRFPALRPGAVVAAGWDARGSDIEVLGLHQTYLRLLRGAGGALVRGARATAVTRDGAGWRVETTAGTWSAAVVVNAAGAWADEVARLAGQPPVGLRPLRRTAFIAPVDAPDGFARWPFLMDGAERFYAKPEGAALLGSPGDETPQPPGDPRADELEVARALDALREVTTFPLRSVSTQWAGQRTFAPDRTPVLGESHPGSGFFWCAGQGGYGIQMAPAIGVLVAGWVRGDAPADPDLTAAVRPQRLTG